tara:strand:- start:133 stop:564 length:432 start_codon:yes stop_codon:yes gene_type:complete
LFTTALYSQQLNVGLNLGTIATWNETTYGTSIEYSPYQSFFSVNVDPYLFTDDSNTPVVTLPLFIKLIIGKPVRLCPNFGISLEANLIEKLIFFAKEDYVINNHKKYAPDKFGGPSREYSSSRTFYMYSFGIKRNIFRKSVLD